MVDKNLKVKCPVCEKKFSYYDSSFRPFCQEKCKQIDLGHWLTESYSVPGEQVELENDLEDSGDYDQFNN